MEATPQLKEFAAKLIWWQAPEISLTQPRRLLGQVMTRGDWPEVVAFKQTFGWNAFRDALVNAEAGLFDIRSWVMWHHFFGLAVPEMPQRPFLKEFGLNAANSTLRGPWPEFRPRPGGLASEDT